MRSADPSGDFRLQGAAQLPCVRVLGQDLDRWEGATTVWESPLVTDTRSCDPRPPCTTSACPSGDRKPQKCEGQSRQCLATAASSAEEDSQKRRPVVATETILPDDEVSTNHGWSCTP